MGGFLYFVEGLERKPEIGELVALGLGHVFDGRTDLEHRLVRTGPCGCSFGVLVWVRDMGTRGAYVEAQQEWVEVPAVLVGAAGGVPEGATGRVCLGWERGAKPGPEALRRARLVPGHVVMLGDGRGWLCPVAREVVVGADGSIAWRQALDKRTRLDRELGVWVEGGVAVQYEELWRIAELFWGALRAAAVGEEPDGPVQVTFDERIEYALRCLRVNYRVGPMEAEVLELLPEVCAVQVLQAVVDMPVWLKLLADKKKRVTHGGDGPGGGAD